jgi:hypothetical protein
MVRHQGLTAPFAAVHEACFEQPVAVGLRLLAGSKVAAVEVTHADGGRRLVGYETGDTPDGFRLKGRCGVVELDAAGRLRSLVLVRGQELRLGAIGLETEHEVCLSVTCDPRGLRLVSSPPIGYETLAGSPVYAAGADVQVNLALPAECSPTGREFRRQVVVPGQTSAGPRPLELPW